MSLIVRTSNQPNSSVQRVALAMLQAKARQFGSSHAGRSDIAGVTGPTLSVDQTGLQYGQRRTASGGIEFRFDRGTLSLALRHQIFMLNTLSACERGIWERHERGHVADNVALLPRLDGEIRRNTALKAIFIDRQWRPRSRFQATQNEIQNAVGAIFLRLTGASAGRRDTAAEYGRIRQQIRNDCR